MPGTSLAFDILARDRASKTFKDVGDAAERTGKQASGIGDQLAGMGGMMVKAGKVAGAALGGLGAAGAIAGLKTASGMEQARISFETMLGSAEKADGFLRDLAKFAAKTPFEFPELQTAASSLISAGFEAGKVIPIMRTLGDVTSGMGTGSEGVKRATVALQQMSAAGRITGEDLNQLRDAGIPVFDLLAAATGKSKEKVVELANAGKLGKTEMEALFTALETGKGLERFNGLMEKQSQSLAGVFSTLKDTVNMTLAQLVQPALPVIKDGLTRLSEVVAGAGPAVQGGLSDLWAKLDLSGLADTFREGAAQGAGGFLSGLDEALGRLDASGLGRTIGTKLAAGLEAAADVAVKLTAALGRLIERVDWGSLAMAFGRQVPVLVLGLVTGLLNFDIGSLFGFIADHWFEVLLGAITLAFLPAKLIALLGKIPLIGPILKWALEAIQGVLRPVFEGAWKVLTTLGQGFISGIRAVFPTVGKSLFDALTLIPTRLGVAAIEAWQFAARIPIRIGEALLSGLNWVASGIGRLVATLINGLINAGGAVVSAANNLILRAVTPFTGLGGRIAGAVGDIGGILVRAGSRVIDGFIDGIMGGFRRVRDTLGRLTSMLPDWKGPAQTDARILFGAGQLVMQGFERGLASQFSSVQRTLGDATDALSPAISGSMAGGVSRGGGGGLTIIVQGPTDPAGAARAVRDELLKIKASGMPLGLA